MQIKRVVTAVDGAGNSIIQEDQPLAATTAALFPDTEIWTLWGTEGAVVSPVSAPAENQAVTFFPGPGGTRFGIFSFPPEQRDAPAPEMPGEETMATLVAEAEQKLPGLLGVFDPDAPGMHQTVTVDYCVVLTGTLTLQIGNGDEAELPPGSCVVQNGTRHAWHNYGSEKALLAFVIVDAQK